jgi:hypothetical protein
MELKEGQSLKYNGSSKISKIAKIEGETVYFTDNSRASIDLVKRSYSEPTMSELISENVASSRPYTPPTQNNQNVMNENNQTTNPQSFGQNSLSGLVDQIKNFNPHGYNQGGNGISIGDSGGANIPTSQPFNPNANNNIHNPQPASPNGMPNLAGLSPETQATVMAQYQKDIQQAQTQQTQQVNAIQNDPFYDQFNNSNQVKEEVKRVNAEDNAQQLADVQSYNRGELSDDEFQKIKNSSNPDKIYRHNPKLPKMRKTKAVKISLVMNEMIPKLEDIRAVDSMFEDVSIIEELGKEIASKYINDPEMLENLIIADLEKKVKSTRKRKTPAKKTTTRKTTTSKSTGK